MMGNEMKIKGILWAEIERAALSETHRFWVEIGINNQQTCATSDILRPFFQRQPTPARPSETAWDVIKDCEALWGMPILATRGSRFDEN